jgi:hypothetical protein
MSQADSHITEREIEVESDGTPRRLLDVVAGLLLREGRRLNIDLTVQELEAGPRPTVVVMLDRGSFIVSCSRWW